MDGVKTTLFYGIVILSFALSLASPAREERGIMDMGSKLVGGAIGVMGTAFYPQEETRYKCVNIMGYGYSGPDSVNPGRYDNMKPEAESNSITDTLSRGVGFMWGNTFKTFLPDSANQEICRQVGMGYHDPQPGYPQTPGGGGPINSSNQPGTVSYQPGSPGSVTYQPGSLGSVSYQPGSLGTTSYQPGTPGSVTYQPGTPGSTIYQPGTPGSVSYQPGSSSTTIYQPGTSGTIQYQQPTPGYTVTTQTQGTPQGMCPCQCPA